MRNQLDPSDMFGYIYHFPEQLKKAVQIGENITIKGEYKTPQAIIFAGMGGSAIGGDVISRLIADKLPYPSIVCRNYMLPYWANESTLVVCFSYSGNTEETLSVFNDAISRNCQIVGISSGGKLMERILEHGLDFIQIPGGLPPRTSLGLLTVPALYLFRYLQIITYDIYNEIRSVIAHLTKWRENFSRSDQNSLAYSIAGKIFDTFPLIYGVETTTDMVAKRWRSQLEENGKILAFHHLLPEMNHNEIVGYENNRKLLKNISIIWLTDKDDPIKIEMRKKLTKQLINGMVKTQIDVRSKGRTLFERTFFLIHLGDWVSYWVAMLNKTDPTPVTKIAKLKSEISKQGNR